LNKEIRSVYEISKNHVFKKGPESWISALGDKYVLFGFKLNKKHTIILKYMTIAFLFAPYSFKV